MPEARRLSGKDLYREIMGLGHYLGASFQWVEQVWWQEGEILCRLQVPDASMIIYYTSFCLGLFLTGLHVFTALQRRVAKYL